MVQPLIITAALTGAEVTRAQQHALPMTPDEVGEAALACAQAGASIVHIHARRADGSSTQAAEDYLPLIEAIQARCDLIVQVSTGGAVGMSPQARCAPLTLRPEMATLSMGTVNFGDDVFMNTPADMRDFLARMQALGVKPEFEIFDSGMLATTLRWADKGVVQGPMHLDFVLGVPGGMPATPASLMFLVNQVPAVHSWTVAAMGAAQLPMAAMGIVLGGHVRVGFEDNIYYRKGELAQSNAQLVARVARLARELERPIATPSQARALLGLPPRV